MAKSELAGLDQLKEVRIVNARTSPFKIAGGKLESGQSVIMRVTGEVKRDVVTEIGNAPLILTGFYLEPLDPEKDTLSPIIKPILNPNLYPLNSNN
ncbi:MAG: hypothetical protein US53_C0031G0009 [Candidatus Woesebacteria bacterium GW2011_GWA1_37_7]|uniref:Uncharacterized protein n=1 Tax=Candidatus Woesebacteria bacterium GW2011_GWA1_37_7 TaxID=1618545 RepID=A0A0G0H480_9BACT|nr:MAG: hypothetical protein US53_C0031G0009 [Candidatus Woesebacteria bacterium GW2011_GWA1_37_7]